MKDQLHKKLTDSYTHESYATPTVLENLAYNIEHNRDFLGREFTYELNEQGWPQFLKSNRARYALLMKPTNALETEPNKKHSGNEIKNDS